MIFVGEKIQETSFDIDTLENFYLTAIVADYFSSVTCLSIIFSQQKRKFLLSLYNTGKEILTSDIQLLL